MEEVPQALRAAGLPDEEIPAHYHRLAPIPSDAGIGTVTPEEREQGLELFRVAVLGADPGRFPAPPATGDPAAEMPVRGDS
ncbi:hypothetical protein RKD21_006467 [Streptomyces albogriseolus]|uniref:Uncharacterized protein n=1 Tax=Streptomyces albogriseolus TaxID=1887 RepID=A0ACC6UXN7_STRAO